LYWALDAALHGGFNWDLAAAYFIPDILIGIGITHGYRYLAHRNGWTDDELKALFKVTLPAVGVTGALFILLTGIKNYLVRWLFGVPAEASLWMSFEKNGLTLMATGIRLMAIWILAFHLYHYARLRIRLAADRARLEIAVKQAELQNLSAQLNPHFFFNALNSIKALVASTPDDARRAVDLLTALLRQALAQNAVPAIPLADEMNLVCDYLELEKIRFEERLAYQINVPGKLSALRLPPLALQALVENAVKHGIASLPAGGQILVQARLTDSALELIVQNSGKLAANAGDDGTGLRNLRERLQLQYQGRASLALSQQSAETVSATLKIPLES
jgi:LytS/YehU family sensor histidine kinase